MKQSFHPGRDGEIHYVSALLTPCGSQEGSGAGAVVDRVGDGVGHGKRWGKMPENLNLKINYYLF
jgi:hypothetical protein